MKNGHSMWKKLAEWWRGQDSSLVSDSSPPNSIPLKASLSAAPAAQKHFSTDESLGSDSESLAIAFRKPPKHERVWKIDLTSHAHSSEGAELAKVGCTSIHGWFAITKDPQTNPGLELSWNHDRIESHAADLIPSVALDIWGVIAVTVQAERTSESERLVKSIIRSQIETKFRELTDHLRKDPGLLSAEIQPLLERSSRLANLLANDPLWIPLREYLSIFTTSGYKTLNEVLLIARDNDNAVQAVCISHPDNFKTGVQTNGAVMIDLRERHLRMLTRMFFEREDIALDFKDVISHPPISSPFARDGENEPEKWLLRFMRAGLAKSLPHKKVEVMISRSMDSSIPALAFVFSPDPLQPNSSEATRFELQNFALLINPTSDLMMAIMRLRHRADSLWPVPSLVHDIAALLLVAWIPEGMRNNHWFLVESLLGEFSKLEAERVEKEAELRRHSHLPVEKARLENELESIKAELSAKERELKITQEALGAPFETL